MSKFKKVLYIAEGEIEEKFIKYLINYNFIQIGQFKKFNLMQEKLKNTSNILTKKCDKIFAIVDTDCLEEENINKLIFNLKQLKLICPMRLYLLIQNKNFEDELKYILNCNNLCEYFGLKHKTIKDLKVFLTQSVNYRSHISKDNIVKYCCRFESFKDKLKECGKSISEKMILTIEICLTVR